jgi:hypothetical protein
MRIISIAMLAGILMAASGCASTEPELASYQDPEIDHEEVAAVEKAARARGVQVMWLQYPRKQNAK